MSIKRLASETAIYGLSSILGRLLNFVLITPFISQPDVLSPEQFGTVGELFFYTAFLIALLVFRMDTAVFRFASRPEYEATAVCRSAQRIVVAWVLVCCGGGLWLAPQLAQWLVYADRVEYVQLFLLIVAFDALAAVPLARLRLEQRAWMFAAVNLANILINVLLIYFFLAFAPKWLAQGHLAWYREELKVSYYFFTVLAAGGLRYILLLVDRWWQNRKQKNSSSTTSRQEIIAVLATGSDAVLPATGAGRLERLSRLLALGAGARAIRRRKTTAQNAAPSFAMMLRYAAPLVVVAVAGIINTLAGPAMIKWFFSADYALNEYWAGQYNGAMKLAVFLTLFTTAYNFAAEPFFFRQAAADLPTTDRRPYAQATQAFAFVNALAIAAILLLLPILKHYLGADKQAGLEILPVLLAANFLLGLYYNFSIAYKLTDRTMLGGAIAVAGTTVFLLINYCFLPRWGLMATATATLACFLLMCLLAYQVSRKYFPVPYPLGRISLYVLLTTAIVALGWPLESLLARSSLLLLYLVGMLGMERNFLRGLLK